MLRARAIALGAVVLLAGCATQDAGREPAPGEDCRLGGPPWDPPADRQAFNLTSTHLSNHSTLAELFSSQGHTVLLLCQDGNRLLEHLASEGADVRFSDQGYGHDVYLSHNETTIFAALRLVS